MSATAQSCLTLFAGELRHQVGPSSAIAQSCLALFRLDLGSLGFAIELEAMIVIVDTKSVFERF